MEPNDNPNPDNKENAAEEQNNQMNAQNNTNPSLNVDTITNIQSAREQEQSQPQSQSQIAKMNLYMNPPPQFPISDEQTQSLSSLLKMNPKPYEQNMYMNAQQNGYGIASSMVTSQVIPQGIVDTQIFMNQIDLRCDDHVSKFKQDVQATRFCNLCKKLVCDSCVIEFHNEHIADAKTKIDEYFRKQRLELEDLRSKINSSIKLKVNVTELSNAIDKHSMIIDSFFSRRKCQLEEMKMKIDSVINEDIDIQSKLKEAISVFYNQECFRRLDNPLKENENLLKKIISFLKDWDTYSKTDKINCLKSNVVDNFKNDYEENAEKIKTATEAFRGKSITIEKKIDEILKAMGFSENLLDFEKLMNALITNGIEIRSKIQKLKYDELAIEKAEILNKQKIDLSKVNVSQNVNNAQNNNIPNLQNMPSLSNVAAGTGSFGVMDFQQQVQAQQNLMQNANMYNSNQVLMGMNNMNNNLLGNNNNFYNKQLPIQMNPMQMQPQNNNNNLLQNANMPGLQNLQGNMQNMQGNQFSLLQNDNQNQNPLLNQKQNPPMMNNNNSLPPLNPIVQNANQNLGQNANQNLNQNANQNLNANQKKSNERQAYNYEYYITIKPKSDELIIYDPNRGFSVQNISAANFNNVPDSFSTFPEHSKFVNLGNSILLTGGYLQRTLVANCYLILVSKSENSNSKNLYEIIIMPYGKMKQPRERHNLVHLPDRNMVLVCSGFFNNGSELSDINTGEWKDIGNLNEIRGNATICYVNNKYVYVFGGYRIIDKKGIYHGNCEYLDMDNVNKGWKMINFANNNLKLSAMGVISLFDNTILLCGGFDGGAYRRDVYSVDMSDPDNPKADKTDMMLPNNFIFMHNTFLKIGSMAYNLELANSVIKFDFNNWGFDSSPFNPIN